MFGLRAAVFDNNVPVLALSAPRDENELGFSPTTSAPIGSDASYSNMENPTWPLVIQTTAQRFRLLFPQRIRHARADVSVEESGRYSP